MRTCVLVFLALALSGSSVSEAPFSRCRLALFIGDGASSFIFCESKEANALGYISLGFCVAKTHFLVTPCCALPCWASSWSLSCCQCCRYLPHWVRCARWNANPRWWARLGHRDWLSASCDHYVALTSVEHKQSRHDKQNMASVWNSFCKPPHMKQKRVGAVLVWPVCKWRAYYFCHVALHFSGDHGY